MATVRIQLRRGTSSQWDTANPTLAAGEIGIETDTNTFKFGDGVTDWNSLSYALSDTVDDYIPLSLKGVANGVAELDGQGYVPAAQLPPLAKVTVNAVADQSARLALTVEPGDIAIQADNGTTYVLQSSPANNNANWKEISATAAISAAVSAHEADTTNVHGIVDTSLLVTTTGTQTLTNKTLTSPVINTPTGIVKADVGLSNVDNTSDADKPVSIAQAAADTAVADAAANALSAHESNGINVHGIADTASLVTTDGNQTLTSKSLTSPILTGTPTAPTAAPGTNTTQIATTEFVGTAVDNLIGGAPGLLDTLNELAAAINDDESYAANITTQIGNINTTLSNKTENTTFNQHVSNTLDVHGISNTANLVYTNDSRLSDERNPVNNTVTTAKIVDNAITTAKILNGAVTTDKLYDSAITTGKLAAGSVTSDKIEDSAINTQKLSDESITTAKIADNAVTANKLSDNSVDTGSIIDLNVTADKLAVDSVTTAKIASGNVTADKLAADSVSTAKIIDLNVTADKLAVDSVTTAKIASGNVTADKLAADSVMTTSIADLNVTTSKIADAAVTDSKLATDSVTSGKIADGSVTSAKIANGTIVNADISDSAEIAQSKVADLISDLADKAPLASPTFTGTVSGITKSMVGLANVDNTSDSDKPVSTATQSALDLKAPLASPTFTGTVSGITKSMVGLANVDNTSDSDKPVSTATQTALDLKANLAGPTFTGTVTLPGTTAIGNVSSTEIGYLDGVTSAIQTQLNAKAASADVSTHTSATTSVHGISDTSQLAYKNAANQTFTGNLEVDGNMTVDGNLTVNGTTFNASATSITIEDNMVQLAHQNAANTVDLGLVVAYNDGTAKHAGIVRDVSANKWKLFEGVTDEPSTTVNFAQGTLDDLEVADITASSATIGDVSNTELQYLNGVTSAIQTQIDSKLATSTAASTYAPILSPTFTGTVSGITKSMVGLGNVDNTSDLAKPVSTATQSALNLKANLNSPTFTGTVSGITASMVGLGNVDNTSDLAKPVSTATQSALNLKANLNSPTFTGTVTLSASGVAFTDGTQTKAGVPSLTTIGSTIGATYNLSTGGLALRDQLIPISGAFAVTVPANSTTAYPIGTSISFYQSSGTGANFVEAAGVTILRTPGLKLRTTSSSATLTKVATDTWLLAGDLSA